MTDHIHIPKLLSQSFGISRSEGRRCLAQGGVTVGQRTLTVEDLDVPWSEIEGRVLQLGTKRVVLLRPDQEVTVRREVGDYDG